MIVLPAPTAHRRAVVVGALAALTLVVVVGLSLTLGLLQATQIHILDRGNTVVSATTSTLPDD